MAVKNQNTAIIKSSDIIPTTGKKKTVRKAKPVNKKEAPRDNEPVVDNKGGRPPLFKTDAELQAAIDKYFKEGVTKRKVVVGRGQNKKVVELEVPTITGLCYYIGFESRQSFYDLEKDDRFSYTIKRARLFIEREYEEQLSIGNTIGAIFALKNMGWRDKSEHEITGKDGKDLIPSHKLTDEELRERISKLKEKLTND